MRIDNPISNNAIITGSFTGSFKGDGTNLTGITAEWDGSHVGNASITGDLTVGNLITAGVVDGVDVSALKSSFDTDSAKLAGIESGAEVNTVTSVASKTGAVSLVKGDVGLGNVDNTADSAKPVSTAGQTALDLKANLASPTFTGTVAGVTATHVGLGNVTNESKATMFSSPTFTGTVAGVTATHVGLGNVDNTSDANKPVSTAGQTALDLKANLASPTFTGTPLSTTPASNDSSTKIATTAYVQGEITDLIGGAGAAFDTLLEISASIANGDSDVVALTTTVSGKLTKADNLSDLTDTGTARTNLGLGTAATTAASAYATAAQGTSADTAYGWGDHSLVGYLTSYVDTNTTYSAGSGITLTGTTFSLTTPITNNNQLTNGAGYITSYTDTDTTYTAGTGVTLTGTSFSIGQSVGTGDTVQFGTVRATADIVAYYSSDERLKDNMVPLAGALDKVKAMGGYSFDWNDKQDIYEAGSHSIGVKAQEVQAQYPELVHEREDKYLSVDYVKLTAVLLEAVKELSAKVDELSK